MNELEFDAFSLTEKAKGKKMLTLEQFSVQASHEVAKTICNYVGARTPVDIGDVTMNDLIKPFVKRVVRKGEKVTQENIVKVIMDYKDMVDDMLYENPSKNEETYLLLQDNILFSLLILYIYSLPKGLVELGAIREDM